jgi:hypothetical protein
MAIGHRNRLALGVGASGSANVEENARRWLDVYHPVTDRIGIVNRFAAQIVVVSNVKNRVFSAINRRCRLGCTEKDNGTRQKRCGRRTFTIKLRVGKIRPRELRVSRL